MQGLIHTEIVNYKLVEGRPLIFPEERKRPVPIEPSRVLKNKHQAVSQGERRFGKRSIFKNM